jgi:hypothetical protein
MRTRRRLLVAICTFGAAALTVSWILTERRTWLLRVSGGGGAWRCDSTPGESLSNV